MPRRDFAVQPASPVIADESSRRHDLLQHFDATEHGDVISGYRFCATMQLRTPLHVLLPHGEIHEGPNAPPLITRERWEGIWIPVTKTWAELGINLSEPPPSTMASDVGQIPEDGGEYLQFLIVGPRVRHCERSHGFRAAATAIRPATPRVLQACDAVDELIAHFLAKRLDVYPSGEFEAPIEALNLLYLAIRHTEGVMIMARHDLVALPPAMLAARAAFEAAALAAWLVDCEDPFEAEARWLAHLRKEGEYLDRLQLRRQTGEQVSRELTPEHRVLTDFANGVSSLLAAKGVLNVKKPNFAQLLTSLGAGDMYVHYVTLSQYAHSTHYATGHFRKGQSGGKAIGERVAEDRWELPLHLSCEALARFGKLVLDKTGRGQNRFPAPELIKRTRKYIRRVGEVRDA